MINLAQHRSVLRRGMGLVTMLMVLLVVGGCNNQQPAAIPTPDLEILAPTATGVTARVEVVVVVVTATSEPTAEPTTEPTAEPTAPPEPTAGATEASSNDSAVSPTAAPDNETAASTATPGTGDTEGQQSANSSGQPTTMSNQQLINRGEEVYSENCASCHQPNGEGTDLYPALNQSGLLESGDPTQAIQLVLYGRGEMPAFEDTLSNQQIASVLSYERNAWQNDGSVVRVAQVRQVRRGGSADAASQTEPTATTAPTVAETASAEPTVAETTSTEPTATESSMTETPETTPTPAAESTAAATVASATISGTSATDGPTVAVTWTPARAVTPLLPTTEITGAHSTSSTSQVTPAATATATGPVTVTAMTATPTSSVGSTGSATTVSPTVSLTWTPARAVTPLLPTTELTTTASDDSANATGTPTPPTTMTVSATGTVTDTPTGNATSSDSETTVTPAESPTAAESADTGGESANAVSDEELISIGETVYATECASCHQINGEGNSTYPALNGSELLTADDPTAAISIVLNGQGEMPAFNEILSTEEIAAVLSHERNAWDNNASVVTVAQVEEVGGN